MAQSKHWVFTVFADQVSFFDHEKVQYCIFGNEKCPKTGRWHKQGYVCFKNRVRLPFLKLLDATAHWEVKRGTVTEAIDYCKKDGDYYQCGECPVEERSNKNVYSECIRLAESGQLDKIKELYPGQYLRYKKTFDSLVRYDYQPLPEPRGIWVYGKPGAGKDTTIMNKYSPFVKTHNKWFDGYDDQENILWSDFDPEEIKYFANYFKQWADRYPFTAEFKGGSRKVHPKRFIVTSNFSLDIICENTCFQMKKALKRRFAEIDYDNEIVTKRPKVDFVEKSALFDDF